LNPGHVTQLVRLAPRALLQPIGDPNDARPRGVRPAN
jgi:hypothetical protein